jgi:hypothetical protein
VLWSESIDFLSTTVRCCAARLYCRVRALALDPCDAAGRPQGECWFVVILSLYMLISLDRRIQNAALDTLGYFGCSAALFVSMMRNRCVGCGCAFMPSGTDTCVCGCCVNLCAGSRCLELLLSGPVEFTSPRPTVSTPAPRWHGRKQLFI